MPTLTLPIMASLTGLVVMFVILKVQKAFVMKVLALLGSLAFSIGIFLGNLPGAGLETALAGFGIVETLAAIGMWISIARRKEVRT